MSPHRRQRNSTQDRHLPCSSTPLMTMASG
jgi:hypothetical protein